MNFRKLQENLEIAMSGEADDHFLPVVSAFHCMSTPRNYAILNAATSAMDENEIYLEVGTYQGGSLVSALLKNQVRAIGVDSFSEFTGSNNLELTTKHLADFGVLDRVSLRNMGFADFFAQQDPSFRAQVYYYDGAHDYQTQLAGLETAWPFLANDAVILVDDYTYFEVSSSLNQFIANHRDQVKLRFVMLPADTVPPGVDKIWWNGVVVLQVKK